MSPRRRACGLWPESTRGEASRRRSIERLYEGEGYSPLENSEDRYTLTMCGQCGQEFEQPDMAHCPFHETSICSLCCTLEKKCHDMCKKPLQVGNKPEARTT